jgi:FdhD protein
MLAEPIALVVRPPARERQPVPGAPRLSQASGQLLRRIEIVDEHADQHTIDVPVERPLTVMVDGITVGTLWTLGASPECLVLGYLWNQRLITQVAALGSIDIDWEEGVAKVGTRSGTGPETNGAGPQLLGIAGHIGTQEGGLVTHEEVLTAASLQPARISRSILLSILEGVPQEEAVYRAAGSVHGCALFRGAELWLSVEDVSRRNAIDTITGWMALHGVAGADKVLFTTGRFSAEIVMKAAYSGIPVLISRKGLTATSYDLACRLGMTLFGHAAPGRYICYAGVERFDAKS